MLLTVTQLCLYQLINAFTILGVPDRTVRMIDMPCFYVGKLRLHHYKSDLAHTSDLYSLVIGLYKSEI